MESGVAVYQFVLVRLHMPRNLLFLRILLVFNCGDLPGPDNGLVTVSIGDFGSNASYTCETGYNLNGDMNRMCQDNGDWSGSAPTCDRKLRLYFTVFMIPF